MTLADRSNAAPTTRGSGERTVVFGGSGFLGSYVLQRLPAAISVGRTPPPTSNRHLQAESLADLDVLGDVPFDKVVYIVGNSDRPKMEREHLGRGEPSPFDYHVSPLLQTLEQLKGYPIKKLLHFSTVHLYDQQRTTLPVPETAPLDPYRNRYVFSKYLAEQACTFYGRWLPIINIRTSNLYGPTPLARYDVIHGLIEELLDKDRAEVWSTATSRDFIYVEDAAEAVVELLDADYTGTVNLGTGTMTSVREIVGILEELSGRQIVDLGKPVEGPSRFQCDTTLLERLIEWRPRYPIRRGVERTYETMAAWREQPA